MSSYSTPPRPRFIAKVPTAQLQRGCSVPSAASWTWPLRHLLSAFEIPLSSVSRRLAAHPGARHEGDYLQGILTAACDAFFEIALNASHPVSHVCKTDNRLLSGLRKGVQG